MKKLILVTMMMLPLTSEAGPLSKLLGRSTSKEASSLSKGSLKASDTFAIPEGRVSVYHNIIPGAAGVVVTKKLSTFSRDEIGFAIDNSLLRLKFSSPSNQEKIKTFLIQNADNTRLEAITSVFDKVKDSRVVELSLHGMDSSLVNEAYSLALSRGLHAVPRDKKLYEAGRLYKVSTLSFYMHKSKYSDSELKAIAEVVEFINRRHFQTPPRAGAIETIFSRKSVR